MTGQADQLFTYMDGSKNHFIIPVYQRKYDWQTTQCQQLFDDLKHVILEKRETHFFGCIVAQHIGAYDFILIDGQQRLTTVTLLLIAMRNLLNDKVILSEDETLPEQIEAYLISRLAPAGQKTKLRPFREDAAALKKLLNTPKDLDENSNLTQNYHFFERCIKENILQRQNFSIEQLIEAIGRLQIIAITLDGNDNAQLIFESLNATGLNLKEGDKVRNYVLMQFPSNQQEHYYDTYWREIECLVEDRMDFFLRDYLGSKLSKIPPLGDVYLKFKRYVTSTETQSLEECLNELLAYAKRYNVLVGKGAGGVLSRTLKACIERLNHLEKDVVRPFLMEVLRLKEEGKLPLEEVEQIFLITESFIVRRLICDVPTNALNKIFVTLHREIERMDDGNTSYFERFKYAIASKTQYRRFPDDDEFLRCLGERDIYRMSSKNVVYLLERFENHDSSEDHDVYRHVDIDVSDKWSIEHVMPQTLTPDWVSELGPNAQEIHKVWCHRLANLTLTAYNSKYSNSSFIRKKTCDHGYNESGIRMNLYIAQFEKWDLAALESRDNLLKTQALTLWPMPVSSFHPVEKTYETCTFGDIEDDLTAFSGRKPRKISYKGREAPVKTWKNAYITILSYLYEEIPERLRMLASDEGEGGSRMRDRICAIPPQGEEQDYARIADKVYARVSNSTWAKLNVLKLIFEDDSLDAESLVFSLAPQEDDDQEH